ncbi:alpha/beta hydrolase [Aliikangiella sp. IMCC44359]|uniref:alpha/beta hydrolase n=1 Tax=Aliikangiella sp. IMCC44359 TaxID=3459125 RepID=UPI00403B2D6F
MLKKTVGLLLIFYSINVSAQSVTIRAQDGFRLAANYFSATKQSSKGVLMLHQCNANKAMYSKLGQSLSAEGIHALAIDFRGYGESVNDEFSREIIRKKSANNDESRKRFRKIVDQYWQDDVIAAYQYLQKKTGGNNISFIGASCGGVQSILLAKKHPPQSFIFFSSGMRDNIIKQFKELSHIPALIIASVGDEYTFKSSNEIFLKAKSKSTRLLSYKGSGHGVPLFKQDPQLKNTMVAWFKQNSK